MPTAHYICICSCSPLSMQPWQPGCPHAHHRITTLRSLLRLCHRADCHMQIACSAFRSFHFTPCVCHTQRDHHTPSSCHACLDLWCTARARVCGCQAAPTFGGSDGPSVLAAACCAAGRAIPYTHSRRSYDAPGRHLRKWQDSPVWAQHAVMRRLVLRHACTCAMGRGASHCRRKPVGTPQVPADRPGQSEEKNKRPMGHVLHAYDSVSDK